MGKLLTLILISFVFSGCGLTQKTGTLLQTPTATIVPEVKTTLVLDYGGGKISTYSGISAKTALDALTKIAEDSNITVDVKKYNFGMLVNAIGGKENSKDLAWIYYVNGKSPDVGADKYELKDGDRVEWKYQKPNF